MLPLRVRPEAELDALDAAAWYDGERAGLGPEFLDELRTTFERIEDGPERFPRVFQECRRAIVHRFPFGVFFVVEPEFAAVVAIASSATSHGVGSLLCPCTPGVRDPHTGHDQFGSRSLPQLPKARAVFSCT